MKIYSVYDKRAKEYGQPMAMPTDAHAARSFTQEVNRADSNNMLNQYPADFVLFRIGTFNTNTGHIEPENELLLQGEAALKPADNGNQKRA